MANFNDGLLGSFSAVRRIGISLERLSYWEKKRILNPRFIQCGMRRYRRYSQGDIRRAILVKMLVDGEGYSLEGAIKKVRIKEL